MIHYTHNISYNIDTLSCDKALPFVGSVRSLITVVIASLAPFDDFGVLTRTVH